MSIDPVAAYAAAVATAALGWQVYQWRTVRRGKLDVQMSAFRSPDGADEDDEVWCVDGVIFNRNDYPVRLEVICLLATHPAWPWKGTRYPGGFTKPGDAGLPDEISARANVRFDWESLNWSACWPGTRSRPATTQD